MFNSIGWGEILVLLVVGLFIFGPDRLPSIAKDAAGAMQKARGLITGARNQIRDELGDEFADIDLRSLNPREFVRRQLLDDDPPPLIKRSTGARMGANATRLDKSPAARMSDATPVPGTTAESPPRPVLDKTPAADAAPVSRYDDIT